MIAAPAVKNKQSMYTLSNRPYKLIANSRRGITQKVDPLETNSNSRDSVKCDMSIQRPVFHQINGRRTQVLKVQQESFPPQYAELIKYIDDTWTGISKEYEISKHSTSDKVPKITYYQDTNANTHLANFEPFDLESFWGERFLQNIQQST